MGFLKLLLFLFAIGATVVWVVLYIFVTALGCSYVASGCGLYMPWQLDGESLTYLVLIPGIFVSALWLAAFRSGRER